MAVLNLSYEGQDGVYGSATGIGVLDRNDDPAVLGVVGNLGYARRLSPALSVDGGVNVTHYFAQPGGAEEEGFTEVYAGASGRRLSGHIFYSPNYYAAGVRTLYGEVEGTVGLRAGVRLSAHLGYLAYLSTPAGLPAEGNEYDWRIGLARTFGRVDVHTALTGGGPGEDHYAAEAHGRTTLTVGASVTF